jgi:hypothetical protein
LALKSKIYATNKTVQNVMIIVVVIDESNNGQKADLKDELCKRFNQLISKLPGFFEKENLNCFGLKLINLRCSNIRFTNCHLRFMILFQKHFSGNFFVMSINVFAEI